jgi:hypothetical protein
MPANKISIYPNPVRSYIFIQHLPDEGLFRFILRNQQGQQIKFNQQEQFYKEERLIKLSVSELLTGLYFLEIWHNRKRLTTEKILIK